MRSFLRIRLGREVALLPSVDARWEPMVRTLEAAERRTDEQLLREVRDNLQMIFEASEPLR